MSVRATIDERLGNQDWHTWPTYDAAELGLPNYWYPIAESRHIRSKPVAIELAGRKIMLIRDGGEVFALHDRCLHRGVPLSFGASPFGRPKWSRQEFPGTISCGYHGWTYDLRTGVLVAALTDGPDSPICGKVRVRTYPVAERIGLVWVYIGEGEPPPVEDDIPEELLQPETTIFRRTSVRKGNWRYACENGMDEAHARYLHRDSFWTLRFFYPGAARSHVEALEGGKWITYVHDEVVQQAEYPSLGVWPRKKPWEKSPPRGASFQARAAMRLPCMLRVSARGATHYSWFVPVTADSHTYVQLTVKFKRGLAALRFKIWYTLYSRWFYPTFTRQDDLVIAAMDAPPERLFRPDAAIVAWRKLCEQARGQRAEGMRSGQSPDG